MSYGYYMYAFVSDSIGQVSNTELEMEKNQIHWKNNNWDQSVDFLNTSQDTKPCGPMAVYNLHKAKS